MFRGALQGENLFSSLDVAGDWERGRTTQRGQSSVVPHAHVHMRMGWPRFRATHWKAVLATASRCVEGSRTLMSPWCAEGEVPTTANLNLYQGWKSCVGWHCDDEPLFGKCGDAKLIVSVSLGNFAVFRWRRQSCPADEGHSCRLNHGDIIVMDGQCQDEFLHGTDPGREQDRINITFRWVKQHVLCLRQGWHAVCQRVRRVHQFLLWGVL